MFIMQSVNDLWDHIAYVIAYAPNHFPHRDFIPDNEQMNLERAFDQLRLGIKVAFPESSFELKWKELGAILERSYSAYRTGDEVAGAHLLNEFQDNIFKANER